MREPAAGDAGVGPGETTASDRAEILADGPARSALAALDDDGCRAILDATGAAALSATEIAESCGLPLSTTYRKLEVLTDAHLLEERTRIKHAGKHPSEYVRSVEDVIVSVETVDGTTIRIRHRDPDDAPWSVPSAE